MNYIIETKNLTKRYGKNTVVKDVCMHIPDGSVYGFVGENGSGKTTIMRLLMGLANPTKGSYSLYGVSFRNSEIYNIRKNISAIVETPSLIPTMTATDNLKYACLYYGIKDLSIIPEVLKEVGLADTKNKKVKNFSLGMKQRLGIAVVLLNQPKLLLLDEPLNGLDPAGIAEVRDLINNLNKKGITILISSHILSELEKVATWYGFIKKGELIEEISAKDLAKKTKNSIEITYDNIDILVKALKKIGIKSFDIFINKVRIYDVISPLDLLTKLHKNKIDIMSLKANDSNVENYYLNLINGGK